MVWQTKKLADLCEFKNGLWKGKKEPFQEVSVIRNTNFTKDGVLDYSDVAVLDVEQKQFESRNLEFGDLILEKSGGGPKQPVGRVVAFEKTTGDYSFSNFTSVIRLNNVNFIYYRFLHKYLNFLYSSGKTESLQRNSTGIRNLQLNEYKQLEIPVPPFAEQKQIVSILDEAFANIDQARQLAERNIKNARELFDSHLKVIFDGVTGNRFVEKNLEAQCELIVDCEHKTAPTEVTGYPSIRTPNIQRGILSLENVNKVSEETYQQWTQRAVPLPGDLVMAREAPAGNVAVIPEGIYPCLGQRTLLIRPKTEIFISEYLMWYLLSPEVQARLLSTSRGATVQHVNMKDIRALEIKYIPDLYEQKRIVKTIEDMRQKSKELEVIYQQKITALDELKQSLLQKAFRGELTNKGIQAA